MTEMAFRRLQFVDVPRLADWQGRPHVARWWREPADIASITSKYAPVLEGRDPTEVFVIEFEGEPVGLIQRYLLADNPEWVAALGIEGIEDGAGIDYYVGEQRMLGRGFGNRAIAQFAGDTFVRYPAAAMVVAAPQQDNVASWRALEKAGFEWLAAKLLNSDDPSDAGPAYVYGLRRARRAAPTS